MADNEMKADQSRLRSYIQQGRLKKIRSLLNSQPKRINYFLEQRFDACAQAVKYKQIQILRLLHEYDFPVDGYSCSHSITALIIAIRRSDLNFVRTLIELGSDVNHSVRNYSIIPLIEAYQIYKNKHDNLFSFDIAKEIFRYLLQSGASPNVYNVHHMRLIHLTAIDGEFDCLKLLLDYGGYVNAITMSHRKNLLHLICDRTMEQPTENLLQMVRTLIQLGCNINFRDDCFETPLLCTLHQGGNLALAHELIIEGTGLDLKNNFGNTYLTRAVHYALYDHALMALYAGAPTRAWQCSFPYTNRNYQQQKLTSQTSLMDAIAAYERFVSKLEHYLVKPRQLKDIARMMIRSKLPCPMSKSMTVLETHLPRSLIDYLMLKEMKIHLNLRF